MQPKPEHPTTSPLIAQRARELRAQMTASERKLWAALRGGRLGYRVLRLEAELVMRNMPAALERIRAVLAAAP